MVYQTGTTVSPLSGHGADGFVGKQGRFSAEATRWRTMRHRSEGYFWPPGSTVATTHSKFTGRAGVKLFFGGLNVAPRKMAYTGALTPLNIQLHEFSCLNFYRIHRSLCFAF